MPGAILTALIVATTLGGCAWILPKPSAQPADTEPSAACTLDLVEQRKARSGVLRTNRTAEPLIISLAAGHPRARGIYAGDDIRLRGTSRAVAAALLAIESVDGLAGPSVAVRDGSIVSIASRPSASVNGAPGASTAPIVTDFRVLKADTPSPNRPTSCDDLIRDGDYVLLESVAANTWVGLRKGVMVSLDTATRVGPACHEAREQCYTDRAGALLCTNYVACRDADQR